MPGLLFAPMAALSLLAMGPATASQGRLALEANCGAMALPLTTASPVTGHLCAESEIRLIVRGAHWALSGRQSALLDLAVPRGTTAAERLAWRPISSAPLSSELLTQHTSGL